MGVFVGPKVAGSETGSLSIQFLVKNKGNGWFEERHRIPSFICGRRRDGSSDRRIRIPTDVLPAGDVRPLCGCGAPVEGLGARGTVTLLFRNKSPGDSGFYFVTCAHVAGPIGDAAPPPSGLETECSGKRVSAQTIVVSTRERDVLQYDIALARIQAAETLFQDLSIPDTGKKLRSFEGPVAFGPADVVSSLSGSQSGEILSAKGECPIQYPSGALHLKNLWILRGTRLGPGDSGGLIYRGDRALGMLVASTETGLALFHILEEAVNHARSLIPEKEILVFHDLPTPAAGMAH